MPLFNYYCVGISWPLLAGCMRRQELVPSTTTIGFRALPEGCLMRAVCQGWYRHDNGVLPAATSCFPGPMLVWRG